MADWQRMKNAPRDGTNILLRWGSDGVSQGKYIPGLPKPWQFIDTNDGITWLINHAVDNEYGPTHWAPMPPSKKVEPVAWLYRDHYGTLKLAETDPPPEGAFPVYTAGAPTPDEAQRFMVTSIKHKSGIVTLVALNAEDVLPPLESGQFVTLTPVGVKGLEDDQA